MRCSLVLSTHWHSFSRIASEQRDAERRKREFQEIEKAVAITKRKFKQETTEVMLGVRSISFRVKVYSYSLLKQKFLLPSRNEIKYQPKSLPLKCRDTETNLFDNKEEEEVRCQEQVLVFVSRRVDWAKIR